MCRRDLEPGICLIVADGTLTVIDLKYGKGVAVDAEWNPQMMLYGLGALELFDAIYDIDTVRMTIYQPRLESVSTWEISVEDLKKWTEEVLIPKAQLAIHGEGNFQCGAWCRFCKAKNTCRARAEEYLKLAQMEFRPHPQLCCKACNVELAQTQVEIEAMPNGAEILSIYPENDIETYRDVLHFVAQVLGGFFVINREGKLELRKYGTVPVMEIQSKHRFSSSFSDFITRYTAVSSTNLRTQTAEYYALETDDGLTMNLGINPLLQFGLEETRKQLCENILNDLSAVNYVPFDSSTIGNPALDLGDVLTFTGGQADGNQSTCITSFHCKIGGKHSLKCVGKNPRLSQAKSKNDKNISGLLNQIEAGKIGIHTFTNASAYSVADTNVRIISIEFASKEETHVQFFGQVVVDTNAAQVEKSASAKGTVVIPFPSTETEAGETSGGMESVTNDISVEVELPVVWTEDGKATAYVTFEFNDEEILIHHPVETWGSGKHILSLYYPIDNLIPNITNTFNVYLRMEGGTGIIETGECIASISGQAMAAAAAWDGKITIEETTGRFAIGGGMNVKSYSETIKIETMELVIRSYSDRISGRTAIGAFCCPVEIM